MNPLDERWKDPSYKGDKMQRQATHAKKYAISNGAQQQDSIDSKDGSTRKRWRNSITNSVTLRKHLLHRACLSFVYFWDIDLSGEIVLSH